MAYDYICGHGVGGEDCGDVGNREVSGGVANRYTSKYLSESVRLSL